MFSSEQTFTINGEYDKDLEKVLELAISFIGREFKSFYKSEDGLIFYTYKHPGDRTIEYPFKATVPILTEQIKQYIKDLSDEEILRLAGMKPDNDGSVRLGWEVFHPMWYGENEITEYDLSAKLAVRPHWIVYGK